MEKLFNFWLSATIIALFVYGCTHDQPNRYKNLPDVNRNIDSLIKSRTGKQWKQEQKQIKTEIATIKKSIADEKEQERRKQNRKLSE